MRENNAGVGREAIEAFSSGDPVLVYDAADREGEVDIIYPAGVVQEHDIARIRNDAGGLVCVAVSDNVATELELPWARNMLDHPVTAEGELAYDDRSAASITVNHRDTVTGITDADRSRTIQALSATADEPELETFTQQFRSPGHVHLLRAAPDLLENRHGHTEFAVALAVAADRPPAAVVCEMLDDQSGAALSPTDAMAYAQREDLVYLEMSDAMNALL